MNIFLDDEDRKFILSRLQEYLKPLKGTFRGLSPEGALQGEMVMESHTPYMRKTFPTDSFTLLCYCLMPNHFHFLFRQNSDSVLLSQLMLQLGSSYSKYFNRKYARVGSLFQDQFKAIRVETDPQLLWLSAYIHNNPKTAGLVGDLKDYGWSSYLDYVGLRQETLCDKDFITKMVGLPETYKRFVDDSFEKIKERKDLEQLLLD